MVRAADSSDRLNSGAELRDRSACGMWLCGAGEGAAVGTMSCRLLSNVREFRGMVCVSETKARVYVYVYVRVRDAHVYGHRARQVHGWKAHSRARLPTSSHRVVERRAGELDVDSHIHIA